MSSATCSLYILEGWIRDRKTLRNYIDLISTAANEISRVRGNTIVILCSEVIYLFTYYLSINIWYLIRLKVVIIKEKSFLGVVPNLTAGGVFLFFFYFFKSFFGPFGVLYAQAVQGVQFKQKILTNKPIKIYGNFR